MGGRGRGRGRGRGSQMSFDYSQLGFTGGEALPAPVLQPPPTFPPLEHKAVPLKSGPEMDYMVALKRDFVEFFNSKRQNYDSSSTIERFSDKYQLVLNSETKDKWESILTWEYVPIELNPKGRKALKRKAEKAGGGGSAKKPHVDITKKLDELAKLEDKDEEEEEEDAKESEEKEGDDENENRENPEEEDEDEEMDDGTDYVNNYFDNGESYFDDEDDNLDDGPVY